MAVEITTEVEGAHALAARLEDVGEALLAATGAADRALSLLLTDDAAIRALNARWRGEDRATDVLSFPVAPEEAALIPAPFTPLGDVVISVGSVERAAAALGVPLADHAVFLLVHGVCHLLGHDHGEPGEAARMRAEEDRLLAAVAPGQARPPTPY